MAPVRNKSTPTLRVRLVQAVGDLDRVITKETFRSLCDRHGGSLWVPGTFGQHVRSETEMIGCWHWKGEYLEVSVSILLFANGKCKMSLGTGSWDPIRLFETYESDPWIDFCGFFCEKMCGHVCTEWTIHLMSADKRYERSRFIRTEGLAEFWRKTKRFDHVIDPHTFETGRISTVKGYIEAKKLITVDHRGNVHFTGFKSWTDLRSWVYACDDLLDQYVVEWPNHE